MNALRPPAAERVRRLAADLRQAWRAIRRDLFDGYRPERHYMRGPGPRWREKHGLASRMDASLVPRLGAADLIAQP